MDQSYQTIKRVYLEARGLSGDERRAFLDQACAGETALRAEVELLLGQEETLGDFLARPVTPALAKEAASEPTTHPERIGAYRILKPLGWGGMGVVYLAEQDSPRRAVALKLLRLDAASPAQVARFEREAELLGRLGHPGIARVYEAGWAETETGRRPYFAMELVEGRPLHEHARDARLDLAARVRLVCQLAEAAHYAHERGVVHRDLKPANVLIDERGEPRILDFGVARPLGVDSRATQPGQLVGTLSYMSPEQAAVQGTVDARSDVYSLGVILYELLTGRLPIATDELPLHEAVRRVREDEPLPAGAVRRELKGDLETILGKALAKEPARRYATAAELADDLQLFLDQRPIRARPPTSLYVVWKLVRRHRGLTAGAAAVVLALLAGEYGWVKLHQAREAEDSRVFWHALSERMRDLDEIQELRARGERYLEKRTESLLLLEKWLTEVEAHSARLESYRRDLVQVQALLDRESPIAKPVELEHALKVQTDIVEYLEFMFGPRGPVPQIRAQIAQLKARAAAASGTDGR